MATSNNKRSVACFLLMLSSLRSSSCLAQTTSASCAIAERNDSSQLLPHLDEHGALLQTFGRRIIAEQRVAHLGKDAGEPPPSVPHDGLKVLQSVENELQMCSDGSHSVPANSAAQVNLAFDGKQHSHQSNEGAARKKRARKRRSFICSARCANQEPQLELSLAPWADWQGNFSGMTMLRTLEGFCKAQRERRDPFLMTVLWKGDVYFKTCDAPDVWHSGLYLVGPDDLSMVIVFLLGVQRVATLPEGPIAFGMYLSDYTSLADHFLTGPGLPIFAYLGRDTSWAIPWPSSFTVFSTYEVEWLQRRGKVRNNTSKAAALPQTSGQMVSVQKPWDKRTPKAFWIGSVTGPWEFQVDAGLLAVPRLKFLRLSKEHPQQLEAQWSNTAGYGINWVKDDENVSGYLAPRNRSVEELTGIAQSGYRPVDQWMDYKYFVNLDGVVMGGRLNKLMALGGVVLQHEAGYTEYIDALVKPFEHYVPVSYDLSDLTAKIQWLQENDAEAKRIAENAKNLADQRMRLEDHICYIWRALEALGAKTASAQVDADDVDKHLQDQGFKRATIKAGGMRPTLEFFWETTLEQVRTGKRHMGKESISVLQWIWDRFQTLHADSQDT